MCTAEMTVVEGRQMGVEGRQMGEEAR